MKTGFNGPIFWSCVLVGFAESTVAILQALHLVRGNHEFFHITGTFSNPGQLGGFITVQLFLLGYLVTVYWKRSPLVVKIFLLSLPVLFGMVLFLSQSRASWLAVVIGSIYILVSKIRDEKNYFRLFVKMGLNSLIIGFIVALVIALYHHKKDSGEGRLLIWRVTFNMIADQPLLGHGPGTFANNYFAYQGGYFSQNPDSRFLLLAGNPSYAFNDYLHVTAELGIIGLLIVLVVIFLILGSKPKEAKQLFMKAAFLAFCIFAFFSYPSEVFLLAVMLAFLLASLQSPVCFRFAFPRRLQILAAFIGVPLIFYFSGYYRLLSETNMQMNALYSGSEAEFTKARQFIDSNYPVLKNEKSFLLPYAYYFSGYLNNGDRLKVLEEAARRVPCVEILCELGKQYQELACYNKAEDCFRQAACSVPSRIVPNYSLFQLYLLRADSVSALKVARKMLEQPLKLENTITIKAKAVARGFIQEKQADSNLNAVQTN